MAKFIQRFLFVIVSLAGVVGISSAQQGGVDWSSWHSEETGPFICPSGFINAVECSGDYCDNKRFACNTTFKRDGEQSGWIPALGQPGISEEAARNRFACPAGQYMTAVACDGRYCDNMRFMCAKLDIPHGSMETPKKVNNQVQCALSPQISEDTSQTAVFLSAGELFSGMSCYGRYCDNLEFRSCEAYGGEIPLKGYWTKLEEANSNISETVQKGRETSKEHESTIGVSITESLEVGLEGEGSVGLSSTQSFESKYGTTNTTSEQTSSIESCNAPTAPNNYVALMQFIMASQNPPVKHYTKIWRCVESVTENIPAPVCYPGYCTDNACQTCTDPRYKIAPVPGQ